jgi:hypothetical protein
MEKLWSIRARELTAPQAIPILRRFPAPCFGRLGSAGPAARRVAMKRDPGMMSRLKLTAGIEPQAERRRR